jgi:hypothetical protein
MLIERPLIRSARRLANRLFRVRSGGAGRRGGRLEPLTELHPESGGTRLVLRVGNLSLSRLIPGVPLCRSLACPSHWLAACEGASGQVELTVTQDELELTWQADAIPQSLRFPLSTATPPPPAGELCDVDPRMLGALATAGTAADHQARRYSLACLELDGHQGTITATDGRQLLRLDGFRFPWGERTLLLPANDVFAAAELTAGGPVACGAERETLVIQASGWTLRLPLELDGRYPNVRAVIDRPAGPTNRVLLDRGDLAFFLRHVKRLPGGDREHAPLSLELNGAVDLAVAGDDSQRPLRIRLARSVQVGQPTHRAMNRAYLQRAAKLGLTELLCYGPGEPLVGRGDRLLYLWQPLGGVEPPPNDDRTLRIDSAAPDSSHPAPLPRRTKR